MKICVLATSYPQHSQDHNSVFVHGLSRGIANNDVEVCAVVPHEKGLSLSERIENVQIHRFRYFLPLGLQQVAYGYGIPENLRHKFWARMGLPFFVFFFFLKSLRQSRGCDLIHAHWEISALIAVMISWWRKIPVILSVHRLVVRSSFMRWLTGFLFRHLDELHFNSSYTLAEAKGLCKVLPPHSIIYPSVDVDFFQPDQEARERREFLGERFGISKDQRVILGLGRLVEKKGFCYLVEAFAELRKRGEQFQDTLLILGGGGPLLSELKSQAQESCPEGSVFYTDFLKPHEVRALLQEADLMVIPSIEDSKGEIETLGTVAMEAMACGIPVMGSNLGGIPDVIEDQKSGILFEPQNPARLAVAIADFFDHPMLKKELVQEALGRVRERFSWPEAVRKTMVAYENLLSSRKI